MNSQPLNLFPQRVPIGTVQGSSVVMTAEFYRALQALFKRVGGANGDDLSTFLGETIAAFSGQDEALGLALMAAAEVAQTAGSESLTDLPDVQQASHTQAGHAEQVFQPAISDNSPLAFRSVALTASPMTIRADRRCAIHITGSTILSYSRAGASLDVTGSKIIEMNLGDSLRIEYTTAPTITLIPR